MIMQIIIKKRIKTCPPLGYTSYSPVFRNEVVHKPAKGLKCIVLMQQFAENSKTLQGLVK